MKAVIRCDAHAAIGFGHLSRCIALAEAFALSGVTSLFAGKLDPQAQQMLEEAGFAHKEMRALVNSDTAAREQAELAELSGADFLVLDSYRLDADYLAELQSLGARVVLIDDFCALEGYPVDVILNFTWEAARFDYPNGPALVLGPNNLLTRRRLVESRKLSLERPRSGAIENLLIAIGGSDPKGIAARVLRLLGDLCPQLCVHVVSSSGDELAPLLAPLARGSQVLARQPDLADPLLWADAAITGGGLIKYECAYMGVPAASIAQNDGQSGETQTLKAAGLVFDLGLFDEVSDEELRASLDQFISGADLRDEMAEKMRGTFVSDPSAHAANAILEGLGTK